MLWNSQTTLEECLRSLQIALEESGLSSPEILVVDNASTDQSVRIVTRACPEARVLQNDWNRGFGPAVNQAASLSRGAFLLILNPDAFLQNLALARLIDALDAHPGNGMVGPALKDEAGRPLRSWQREPTWWSEFRHLFYLDRREQSGQVSWTDEEGPFQPVEVLEGACLLARRDTFQEIGGFDESYFMYSEDWDLCLRARRAGWQIGFVPLAEVIHVGGVSSAQASSRMFLELYRSKVQYFRRHGRLGEWALYKGILYLTSLSRLLLALGGSLVAPARREGYRDLRNRYLQLLRNLHRF